VDPADEPAAPQALKGRGEPPSETTLERLPAVVGVPTAFVYAVLAPTFRLAREITRGLRPPPTRQPRRR
jgi:hypothetical protein